MSYLNIIRTTLSALKPELKSKYPINSIGLFGSVVRNDFNETSDVDIIVDFNKPIGIEFITLADELEARLKRKIDLVSKNGIKPKYLEQIESEIIYV
ncbi:nucleotidyltransferase family protein [Mucilaginibacter roseus]|uniref:Nucleotidyltransferase family protein n=1 Tax=Mucilaginibacter roseus TaxID=1528868 RepID=A0ABS8U711_9SPHI|nr:nucleotidyltransferase family protein [Mucilaginibacter roseus]MCD8741888.1 nucleotidyltransferase family protein [Mucilaginibacter roseus]